MSDNLTQDHVTTEPEQDVEGSQESLESADAQVSEPSAAHDVDVDVDADDADDADDAAEDGDVGGDAPAAPAPSNRRANLEREGEVAADFLETLLDICDLDGDIDVDIEGDRAAVSVVDSEDGRVPRRLVGPNGQVLEALQELTRLAVSVVKDYNGIPSGRSRDTCRRTLHSLRIVTRGSASARSGRFSPAA